MRGNHSCGFIAPLAGALAAHTKATDLVDAAHARGIIPLRLSPLDGKKRGVLPGAKPGGVFACEQKANTILPRRVHRTVSRKKLTKAQALKAFRGWKALRGVKWEELRAREP